MVYPYSHDIDLCLCINKTGEMQPFINTIKENCHSIYNDIITVLAERGKNLDHFRIRVIWFGDYLADKNPMILLPFMTLPDEMDQFEKTIKGVYALGGGDEPEDALEALAFAIRSNWCNDGVRRRHIIAVFTDASTHELGYGKESEKYPKTDMPKDFKELAQMWGDEDDPRVMDYRAKRLLLFAPDTTFWHTISNCWENAVISSVERGMCLGDVTYKDIIDKIVACI